MAALSKTAVYFEMVDLPEERSLLAKKILEDDAPAVHLPKKSLAESVAKNPDILVFVGKIKDSSKAIGLYLRSDTPHQITILDEFLFRGPPIRFFEQAVHHAIVDASFRSKSVIISLYQPKPTLAFLS